MRLDVIQLKDFYSGTELGRTTKQLINRVLEKKVDGSLGQKKLNWSPQVHLEQGIEKTISWYQEIYE